MDTQAAAKKSSMVAELVNIVLGLWLTISPAALGFGRHGGAPVWSDVGVGVALVLSTFASFAEWGNGAIPGLIVFLGIWLFMSPFIFAFYRTTYLWNNLTLAFAVIGAAAIGEELRSINSRANSSAG